MKLKSARNKYYVYYCASIQIAVPQKSSSSALYSFSSCFYYVILQHISWIMVSSGCRVRSQHLLHHEQAEERNITAEKLGGHLMLHKERLMVNYGLNKTMAALLGCFSVKRVDQDYCRHWFSTLPKPMSNFHETFLVRPDSFTIRQLEVLYDPFLY